MEHGAEQNVFLPVFWPSVTESPSHLSIVHHPHKAQDTLMGPMDMMVQKT